MYRTDFKKMKFYRQHRQWIIFRGRAKDGSLVTMETVTFKSEVQKNTSLALIIQIM